MPHCYSDRNMLHRFWVILLIALTDLAAEQQSQSSKFLRFVSDGNDGGALQASVVSYRNSAGVRVDLIAAVHVADASFYDELNRSFEQYDSVLYEMIRLADSPAPTTRPGTAIRPAGWIGAMQRLLKDKLELSLQLERIDYSRKNFIHADLDAETFQRMQRDRGESLVSLMLQQMIRTWGSGSSTDGSVAELLVAMRSSDRARQLKLLLARQFAEMDRMLSDLGGPEGTVILTERNRAAMRVLRQRIDAGDRTIGIFYGAGHLNEMEKILIEEMGFQQQGQPIWRTAWNMQGN